MIIKRNIFYCRQILRIVFWADCKKHKTPNDPFLEFSDLKVFQTLLFMTPYEERRYFSDPVKRLDLRQTKRRVYFIHRNLQYVMHIAYTHVAGRNNIWMYKAKNLRCWQQNYPQVWRCILIHVLSTTKGNITIIEILWNHNCTVFCQCFYWETRTYLTWALNPWLFYQQSCSLPVKWTLWGT